MLSQQSKNIVKILDNIHLNNISLVVQLAEYIKNIADDELFYMINYAHGKMRMSDSIDEQADTLDTEHVLWPNKFDVGNKLRHNAPFIFLLYEFCDDHGLEFDYNGMSNFKCIGNFAIWIGLNNLYYPFSNDSYGLEYKQRIPFELCKYIEIWTTPFSVSELDDINKLNDFILYLQLLWLEENFKIINTIKPHMFIGINNLSEFRILLDVGCKHTDYLQYAHHEICKTVNNLQSVDTTLDTLIDKPSSIFDDDE